MAVISEVHSTGVIAIKKKKRAAMWFDEAGLVASIFGIDREIIVCIILLWRMFVSRYARI